MTDIVISLRSAIFTLVGIFFLSCPLAVTAQSNVLQVVKPVVFNAPESTKPGDVVGLQGAFFGAMPVVSLKRADTGGDMVLPLLNTYDGIWLSFKVPADAPAALIVTVSNGQYSSDPVALNGARPYHLDALEVAAGGAFRLFGRSLLVPGFLPKITFDGVPAIINIKASDESMLVATAPLTIRPGSKPIISVDNGNGAGSSNLDRTIVVVNPGVDVFGLGVGWAGGFEHIAARVTLLSSHANCNGQVDDVPSVQAAIDALFNAGGGILRLPSGVCRFAGSVKLRSKVVLQGAGKDKTVIQYEGNYPIAGRGVDLAGVADLTLRNIRGGIESPLMQKSSRVFFKNVRFELGGGKHMFLTENVDFVVSNSEIIQPTNIDFNGPCHFGGSAGLVFVSNIIQFAHGSSGFPQIHDAYIADNHFTRDFRGNALAKSVVHSLTLDFAYRVVVSGNVFDVLGGPVTNKFRNDGETILTEGGGGRRTENIGLVTSATWYTLSGSNISQHSTLFPSGSMPENFGVAIVSGTGVGQSRNISEISGDTLTVSSAWSILPDASSHFATFVWGLEKATIKNNMLKDNPRGIWLYQTAIRDVDVVGNKIIEGGGVYLRSAQSVKDHLFTPMYRVRIANNEVSNTSNNWRSYIAVMFVRMDEDDFGVAATGVEVRSNRLVANVPNLSQPQEEAGNAEGFVNRMHAEGLSQARSLLQTRLLGTIFQDDHCMGCDTGVIIRNGAKATVLDGNSNGL